MKTTKRVLSGLVGMSMLLSGLTFASATTYNPGTYTGTAKGFGGEVAVTVTVDDSKITAVTAVGAAETPQIGGAAITALNDAVLAAQSADVDAITNATVTSKAYLAALNAALNEAKGTATEAVIKFVPGEYTGTARGFGGPIQLKVTFSEDAIENIEVVSHKETAYVGTPAFDIVLNDVKNYVSTGVDTLSGATVTSNALLAAVEDAAVQAGCDAAALKVGKTPYVVTPGEAIEATYDVVIVGGGGAGMIAAAQAAQDGKTVLVLEKNADLGGNTLVAGCSFQAVYPEGVFDPADPTATEGVGTYDGVVRPKTKADLGTLETLQTILNWSEEPFNEKVETEGALTVEEYNLPARGVHAEYLPTLKTLKEQIRVYMDYAQKEMANGKSEKDLTVFSTKELHIFQTYYGGLRLSNDHSYWIYGDFELVSQLVNNIPNDKIWMAEQGSDFNWDRTTGTLIGCLWQRINSWVGGTIDGVQQKDKYGCYFAVPANTVMKANEENAILCRTEAKKLLTNDEGRVIGVYAERYDGTPMTFYANDGVILATGGYGDNIKMVVETNEYWNKDELSMDILTTNRNCADGSGIIMGQEVGAAVTGMGFTQLMPLGWAKDGKLAGGTGSNVIFISPAGTANAGKRFVDESAERDVLSQGQLTFGGKGGLCIQLMNGGKKTAANNNPDKEYFCTLKEACEMTGLDYDTVKNTILEYDAAYLAGDLSTLSVPKSACTATIGSYDENGKYIEDTMLSVRYLAPSTHHTMGGLVVDGGRRVLDENNNAIPGLYAAGEVTGGVFAGNRLGGNAISEIIVSGRIAAQTVAADAEADAE